MTKLTLAAAVVALGLGAQAEALYWCASDIASSTANPLTGTGKYLAYIFADTDSYPDTAMIFSDGHGKNTRVSRDTIKGLLASGDTDALTTITSYALRNASIKNLGQNGEGATYVDTKGRLNSYDSTTGTAYYKDQVVGWVGEGGGIDLFAVIFDSTTLDAASNYMFLEAASNGEDGLITTSHNQPGYSATFEFGSQANNKWYQIGTVPEPTSGILLALGVAALALKRKQAA